MTDLINYLKSQMDTDADFVKVDIEYIPCIIEALEKQIRAQAEENMKKGWGETKTIEFPKFKGSKQLSSDAQMNPQILEDFWNDK